MALSNTSAAVHKHLAETLLSEVVTVHDKISKLDDQRKVVETDYAYDKLTRSMDEYGKKIMGMLGQAQVHATLATVPDHWFIAAGNVTDLTPAGNWKDGPDVIGPADAQ